MIDIVYNEEQYNLLLNEITPIRKMVRFMKVLIKYSLFLFFIPIILFLLKFNIAGYTCLGLTIFLVLFIIIARNMLNNFVKTIENKDFKVIRKKCIKYIDERIEGHKECFQVKTEDDKIYVLISEDLETDYRNKNIDIILGNTSKYVQFAIPNKEYLENNNSEDDSFE